MVLEVTEVKVAEVVDSVIVEVRVDGADVGAVGAEVGATVGVGVSGTQVGFNSKVENLTCVIVLGIGPAKMWHAPDDSRKENRTHCGATAAIHASAQPVTDRTDVRLIR